LQELYAHNPRSFGEGRGEAIITLAAPGDDDSPLSFGEGWGEAFLKRIFDKTLTPGQIDPQYYDAISKTLQSGVAKGLGGKSFGAADYRNTLKAFLDQNIYAFSSARSLYMLEQYRSFLTDAYGEVIGESAFINKVKQISDVDNVLHLKVERNNAIAVAQATEKWQGLQAFALLEYRTSGGENVCPICGGLNGLVMPSTDSRWFIYIPNHFGCHCNAVPAAGDAIATPDDIINARIKAANIPPMFKRNFAEQRLVYADDHPYIQKIGADKLKELDAVKNYGLRSGEKIYKNASLSTGAGRGEALPAFTPVQDKAVANAWWQDMAGSQRGSFEIGSIDNLAVEFDNDFRNHVIEQNQDDRWKFIKELKTLLEAPDEVWSNRLKDTITNIYIKYYDGAPMALIVEANKTVRAVTLYEVKKVGKINYKALQNLRKGILKYKSH
jgi:hypothetical protein